MPQQSQPLLRQSLSMVQPLQSAPQLPQLYSQQSLPLNDQQESMANNFNQMQPQPMLGPNFNIFEYYHQQHLAQNQPTQTLPTNPFNLLDGGYSPPPIHDFQAMQMGPFGQTMNASQVPQSLNASQIGQHSNSMLQRPVNRSTLLTPLSAAKQKSWDEGAKQHQRIEEETSLNESKFRLPTGIDPFHGKSIRSIQLFNLPTAASPRNLHPRQNPLVKAESPRARRLPTVPARAKSLLLDIHSDSCYNFLNKRRFRMAEESLTPLEAFFHKESQNQYKVAVELGRKMINLQPAKRPPVRRTKRYLLVLDIDETLVHSEPVVVNNKPTASANKQFDKTCKFDNGDGTYDVYGVKFRPYLQDFISRMARLYDLAVYTASARDYADVVMDCLDPTRTIFCSRLYRDHCLPVNGMNIKNMACFDGTDVFIVDNLIYSYAFHMNQGIPICAFVDDPMDVELQDLAEILENLPYYDNMPALIQDLLGLDEFYQELAYRLNCRSP